jgi:TatD DNase family protein
MLIDTHCHLTFDDLAAQVEQVLTRANQAGVKAFVNVSTTPADAWRAFDLLGGHPEVFFALGIHPHEAEREAERLAELKRFFEDGYLHPMIRRRIVAIGETGLDFHYDFAPRDKQSALFRAQLEFACAVDLPVVIHARDAERQACDLLNEFPPLKGRVVFHCYSGDEATAERILSDGYWISLTGLVTFKKAATVQAVARLIPDDRLLIETDAPYLSPEPVRNQRPCEPAFVAHTCRYVAALRETSFESLAALTTANARRFFTLPEEYL